MNLAPTYRRNASTTPVLVLAAAAGQPLVKADGPRVTEAREDWYEAEAECLQRAGVVMSTIAAMAGEPFARWL